MSRPTSRGSVLVELTSHVELASSLHGGARATACCAARRYATDKLAVRPTNETVCRLRRHTHTHTRTLLTLLTLLMTSLRSSCNRRNLAVAVIMNIHQPGALSLLLLLTSSGRRRLSSSSVVCNTRICYVTHQEQHAAGQSCYVQLGRHLVSVEVTLSFLSRGVFAGVVLL